MIKKWQIGIVLVIIVLVTIGYYFFASSPSQDTKPLSPPSILHWFGTDINGNDVFLRTMQAFGFEILTLGIVLIIIWLSGLVFGSLVSWLHWKSFREFYLNLIHYIAALPILLVALFLLIVFGAGYFNSVIILSLSIIPTQSLFVYNQVEIAKNEDFLVAKKSYGLTSTVIYTSHLLPYIAKRYNSYTFSRMPEIIMMNLALSFLGLGLQEPNPSLGRMLFDGLSFMFSVWWLWIFDIILIILLFLFFVKTEHKLFQL